MCLANKPNPHVCLGGPVSWIAAPAPGTYRLTRHVRVPLYPRPRPHSCATAGPPPPRPAPARSAARAPRWSRSSRCRAPTTYPSCCTRCAPLFCFVEGLRLPARGLCAWHAAWWWARAASSCLLHLMLHRHSPTHGPLALYPPHPHPPLMCPPLKPSSLRASRGRRTSRARCWAAASGWASTTCPCCCRQVLGC